MVSEMTPGQRVRLAGHISALARRDGTASVVAVRPGQRFEVLLDDTALSHADRLVLWDAADTVPVDAQDPAAYVAANETEMIRAGRAWTTLPYPSVPVHTAPGREHKVVAVWGVSWSSHDYGGYVYGITKCGAGRDGNLLLERSAAGFPKCKRCW